MSIPGSAVALLLAQSGPSATPTVDYLVVAGGGGGGNNAAGGGGAGGFRTANGFSVTAGTTYTVTIGAGGARQTDVVRSICRHKVRRHRISARIGLRCRTAREHIADRARHRASHCRPVRQAIIQHG